MNAYPEVFTPFKVFQQLKPTRIISGQWSESVLSVWPHKSSPDNGMLVCYNLKWFRDELGSTIEEYNELPGVSTERVGHIGQSRYLRSVAEVDAFWAMLTNSR